MCQLYNCAILNKQNLQHDRKDSENENIYQNMKLIHGSHSYHETKCRYNVSTSADSTVSGSETLYNNMHRIHAKTCTAGQS